MLHFDFHGATSIGDLTFIVLACLGNNYELSSILRKPALRISLSNFELSKRFGLVGAQHLTENVSGRILLLVLILGMLHHKNVDRLSIRRARKVLTLV